ncbi:SemiSWEET transporter [Cellulophaga sp. HaHaR_3_176]|uniref:SemiSWEET family sugar transporter n=1 Tax=Cellulophaga sp. HaHaR_3_176 TaxID=1942464 RepID=UPI001C1F89FE|nr:SemiSWEET transporter [Cellulophaga sp. HaHaR_3_176]QWX85010.1 SemiSWEET transporter [Cellulophaga sp. HaHaR_3_176]
MELEGVIGTLAGICTTSAALPQIVKAWRTKQVNDVSPYMFFVLIMGVLLWTLYGIFLKDLAIIITNGISTCLNGIMLVLIFKYRSTST